MLQSAVIGFVAQNENRVLYYSSQTLNYRFEQRGYAGTIIDLYQMDWLDQLRYFTERYDVQFCYGYAGIGAHLKLVDKSIWNELRIPFLSLLHDHPFYFPAHHNVATEYVCNCYAISDFVEVQRNYIKSSQPCALLKISSNGYLPALDPGWNHRDIYGLLLKTGYNLATLEDSFKVMPLYYREITWDCIKAAQKNADLMLADYVRDRFVADGFDYQQDKQIWGDFVYVVRVIDQYLRHWRSNQLVEKIKHLPVLIIGDGWDHIDRVNAKATFLPAVSSAETEGYLRRAKFILNTHPYAQHAWHERVFMGLENGARVVSDSTQFTEQYFTNLPNFMGFSWANSEWPSQVFDYMEQTRDHSFDTAPTQKLLNEHFPPDAVATQMLAIVEQLKKWA